MKRFVLADLFCGAGGTSAGAIEALEALGYQPELTAVNHWPVAVATHELNHPGARHLCASLDSLNPRDLYRRGELNFLWASPECTNHSSAKTGQVNDQSRCTAHCVTRWMEALLPDTVVVENVPPFANWGPLDRRGRPLKSLRGETFRAWIGMMRSLGYQVDYRVFDSADYGDPQARRRLIIQAQRGKRRIVWPNRTHAHRDEAASLGLKEWAPAAVCIDWSIPMRSIFDRERPLSPNTLRRIREGLEKFGGAPMLLAMEHGGRVRSLAEPAPTVTCARGGAFGIAAVLPQHGGVALRPASEPAPTVACSGALALVLEYYSNGRARPITDPLPTVTCRDRFALIRAQGGDVLFRMWRPSEIALAQGFRRDYRFCGTVQDQTRQIGNAVPRRLSRALCAAAVSQDSDVSWLVDPETKEAAA